MKKGLIIGIIAVLLIVVLVVVFYNKPIVEEKEDKNLLTSEQIQEVIEPEITEFCDFLDEQFNSSVCPVCRKIGLYDPTVEGNYIYYHYVNYSDLDNYGAFVNYYYEKNGDNYNVYVNILTALGGMATKSGYGKHSFVLDNSGNIISKDLNPPSCLS